MKREEYNRCISQTIKKDELKNLPQTVKFCVSAKSCSKGIPTEKALSLCREVGKKKSCACYIKSGDKKICFPCEIVDTVTDFIERRSETKRA